MKYEQHEDDVGDGRGKCAAYFNIPEAGGGGNNDDDVIVGILAPVEQVSSTHQLVVELSVKSVLAPLVQTEGEKGDEQPEQDSTVTSSSLPTPPSSTTVTARFQRGCAGSNESSFAMFDLKELNFINSDEERKPAVDQSQTKARPQSYKLSLQAIASLLRRMLQEVEDRIDEENASNECFHLAKQRSLRYVDNKDDDDDHENRNSPIVDNSKISSNIENDINQGGFNDYNQGRIPRQGRRQTIPKYPSKESERCSIGNSFHDDKEIKTQSEQAKASSLAVDSDIYRIHKLYESSVWHCLVTKCLGGSPRKIKPPAPFTWTETGWTFIGVAVTLFLIFGFNMMWEDLFDKYNNKSADSNNVKPMTGVVLGPFGALLTLQFGVTSAPLGQPRNILYGQISSLLIAFSVGSIEVLPVWFRQTLATVLAISFMVRYAIVHPPAGAAALLVSGERITCLSMGSTLIANIIAIVSATIINNMSSERQYPMSWKFDWPELKDCMTTTIHGIYDFGYDVCRYVCYNKFLRHGKNDHDDDEWSVVVPRQFSTSTSTGYNGASDGGNRQRFSPIETTTGSSSSVLSLSSVGSSSRRTQRYSYSTLQWQSLRRANSGTMSSCPSFRSSSSLVLATDLDQLASTSSENFFLLDGTQNTVDALGGDGTDGAVYGSTSIGLPM